MMINHKLNKTVAIVTFGAISYFLVSCATLSKEECLKGEWRIVGYKDGVKGYDMKRLERHKKACKDYGIKPEITPYQEGRKAGLTYYCTDSQKVAKSSEAESKMDQGDWLAIGFNRGKRGDPPSYMQNYVQNCSKYDIQIDTETYQTGWRKGIIQYCTPENGYEVGKAGKDYHDACPAHLAGAFLDQYIAGISSKLSSIENSMDHESSSIEYIINQLEATTDKEARKSLRSNLSSTRSNYNRLIRQHRDIANLYNKAQRMRMRVR